MRNILYIIAILFTSSVFGQIKVNISGQIINHTAKKVILQKQEGKNIKEYIKVNISEDGKFEIKGEVPTPDYYSLKISDKISLNIVVKENDTIKIYTDEQNTSEFTNFIGTTGSREIHDFLTDYGKLRNQLNITSELAKKEPGKRDSLAVVQKNLQRSTQQIRDQFARNNRNSPALIVILGLYNKDLEFKAYESVALQLIGAFPESPNIVRLKQEVAYHKAMKEKGSTTAIGQIAPEISMPTQTGEMLNLSSLRGNYVLVDFWASWCGPCRRENPNVVRAYNKYKEKGFTVYSVSSDSQLNKWKAAIKQDKLAWPNHVCGAGTTGNTGGQTYGVRSIPTTYLLDKEGKILHKNLRGPALDHALEEIFGF